MLLIRRDNIYGRFSTSYHNHNAFSLSSYREEVKYLNTIKRMNGNGLIIIFNDTGEAYSFSSNPLHMFGHNNLRFGVNCANPSYEFTMALNELIATNDISAKPIFVIE
ncbi:MAG: hypothetical protein WCP00_00335 [bacterium]